MYKQHWIFWACDSGKTDILSDLQRLMHKSWRTIDILGNLRSLNPPLLGRRDDILGPEFKFSVFSDAFHHDL